VAIPELQPFPEQALQRGVVPAAITDNTAVCCDWVHMQSAVLRSTCKHACASAQHCWVTAGMQSSY
jgi:hypothetical protein